MTQTRLKQLREEAVLTVHELAEASGVSDDTISKIENGQRIARPSTLRKLAQALVVSPQELRKPAVEEAALAGKAEALEPAGPPEQQPSEAQFPELPGLRAARERRGYSRNELASRAGVPPEEIAALEEGSREADADTLDKLAAGLSAPRAELGFPPDQYAGFLRADQAENERIERELAELSPGEIRSLLKRALLTSRGLRKVRDALDEESADRGDEKRPEVG